MIAVSRSRYVTGVSCLIFFPFLQKLLWLVKFISHIKKVVLAIRLKILAKVFSRFIDFLQTHFTVGRNWFMVFAKKLNPIYRTWISYLWPDIAWPYLYSYFVEKYMALSSLICYFYHNFDCIYKGKVYLS